MLASATPRGVSRDTLGLLFWPESDAEHARNALNQALFALRRDLKQPELVLGTVELRLNPAVITSDVGDFAAALAAGELERAVTLYTGSFLAGVNLRNAPEFERWAEAERDEIVRRAAEALRRLARDAGARGQHEDAVRWWRRLAALEPTSAPVAVGLMEALAASGDVAAALRHAATHAALLRSELDAPPDPAVSALADRLRLSPQSVIPARSEPSSQPDEPALVSANDPSSDRPLAPLDHSFRWIGIAIAAVLIGMLFPLFFWYRDRPRRIAVGAAAPRHFRVFIPPFTGPPDGAWRPLADLTRALVATRLEQLGPLTVTRAAPRPTDTADITVLGHYTRAGERTSLLLTVHGQALLPLDATLTTTFGSDSSVIDSVRALAARMQAVVAVSAARPSQNDMPMSEMASPPESYAAFESYEEGMHYFDVADWRRSLRLLKAAAGRDSGFPMALIMAVRAHAAAGDVDSAKTLIAALEHRPLLPYDRVYFQTVVLRLEGQMSGYLYASLRLLQLAPGSEFAAATAVAAAYRAGQPTLADSLIRSVPLADRFDDAGYPAFTYHLLGDHARELWHLENIRQNYPRSTLILGYEAAAFAAMHRPEDVDRVLASMASPEAGSPGNWMRTTAAEYEVHDQPLEAAKLRERAVTWFSLLGDSIRRTPTIRLEEGAALLAAGHLASARTVYRNALSSVSGLTNTITIHGALGLIAARLHQQTAATAEEHWLARQPRDFTKGYPDVWRARIALAEGDTSRAASLLQIARSAAFPEIDGEHSVDPLHQIPELRGLP